MKTRSRNIQSRKLDQDCCAGAENSDGPILHKLFQLNNHHNSGKRSFRFPQSFLSRKKVPTEFTRPCLPRPSFPRLNLHRPSLLAPCYPLRNPVSLTHYVKAYWLASTYSSRVCSLQRDVNKPFTRHYNATVHIKHS